MRIQTVYNDPSSLGLAIENYPDRLTLYAIKDGILKIQKMKLTNPILEVPGTPSILAHSGHVMITQANSFFLSSFSIKNVALQSV